MCSNLDINCHWIIDHTRAFGQLAVKIQFCVVFVLFAMELFPIYHHWNTTQKKKNQICYPDLIEIQDENSNIIGDIQLRMKPRMHIRIGTLQHKNTI